MLAAQRHEPRPERHDPCFFDPAHGPATRDVSWAPPGGVPRDVPVCFRDAERLAAGHQPDVRLVRLGDRRVAWFASGPLYAAWAGGWYAELVEAGRMDAERLTMTYAGAAPVHGGIQLPLAAAWSDPGAWTDGGMIGGHDFSGYGGGDFGGGGTWRRGRGRGRRRRRRRQRLTHEWWVRLARCPHVRGTAGDAVRTSSPRWTAGGPLAS